MVRNFTLVDFAE